MQPHSTSGELDLSLDIQALRHLVTRRGIAQVLWTGNARKPLENALRAIYGNHDFHELERSVSQQLLLSQITLLPDLLERLYDQNNDQRASQILSIVREIMLANRENFTPLEFEDDFVLLLLQAVIQASLQVLLQAEHDIIGAAYRTTVDLIRSLFEEFESPSCVALKKTGVKLVKDVVTVLTQSSKDNAIKRADKFLDKYSHTKTARHLQEQANALTKDLEPLTFRENYIQATTDALRADRSRRRGKRRKQQYVPADKPDFFSDNSDETSNVTPSEKSLPPDHGKRTAAQVMRDEFDSEALSASSQDSPRPPRKRARRSRESDRALPTDRLENGARQGRSKTPVSRSRGKRYPQLEEELNGMGSPMFSETRPPSERVDHVVRHAKSKRRSKGRRLGTRQQSPVSISLEESSPAHRGRMHPRRHDSSNDEDEGYENRGIDTDDENAMDQMGREGTVLQDLRAKATKLQKAGPEDPLKESVRDAKNAKHRKRRSDPTYSPAPDARGASPLPDSDDESDLSRKKVKRVQLAKSPRGQSSKGTRRASALPGTGGMMFGKTCRTGRFEPFEDKQLHNGLQALGWGAWTEIAREYWDGEYTRAPSSLKDRARTLGLGPHRYPRRLELRGRPRLAENPDESDGSPHGASPKRADGDEDRDEDDIEEDKDDIEEDDIEEDKIATNGTPGSGDGEAEA